jgi:hypothetical protein
MTDLDRALLDLGAHLEVPEASDVTAAVLARLDEPEPRQHSRLLKVAAAVVAVIIALGVLITVSPPVRAAVVHLLRFAGIELSSESHGPLPPSPAPLPDQRVADLPAAQRVSRFPIAVPADLGQPEQVLLVDGTPPRLVSLLYRGGTVRLDEFDGVADLAMFKKVGRGQFDYVPVGGDYGIWVPAPHELYYVDRDGVFHTESARLSAKTLIWQHGAVTLRLEGDFTQEQAIAIANSVR